MLEVPAKTQIQLKQKVWLARGAGVWLGNRGVRAEADAKAKAEAKISF